MNKTNFIIEPGRQELIMTRVFDAPRDRVFRAHTDPAAIPQWWGPRRLTTIVEKMEVRKGGVWRFVQRDSQGNEFAFNGVYHEVCAPERLIQTFEFEGMPGRAGLGVLTLEEQAGKTMLTEKSVFQSLEDRDQNVGNGMEEGARETMERLAELLAKM